MKSGENVKVVSFYPENSLSPIFYGKISHKKILTKKQAIDAFALDMLAIYSNKILRQTTIEEDIRCIKCGLTISFDKFCSHCGTAQLDIFNPYTFINFVRNLNKIPFADYNTVEGNFKNHKFTFRLLNFDKLFEYGINSKDHYVNLEEDAEHIMLSSLLKQKPTLKNKSNSALWSRLSGYLTRIAYNDLKNK